MSMGRSYQRIINRKTVSAKLDYKIINLTNYFASDYTLLE